MINHDMLMRHVKAHPHRLLFATISGAHLYGFPSPDSDFDLRGVHVLPREAVLGLHVSDETIEKDTVDDGLEIDLVTHDVKKYFELMLRRNGYVLEQIFSPLVVFTTPEHAELKSIASGCITKHHAHHYLGFADTQWKLFSKENPPRVKPLLYVYRVLLTGIHLMRTGRIEANLATLSNETQLRFLDELIARKREGAEQSTLPSADLAFHEREVQNLFDALKAAYEKSDLPDQPSSKANLHDLLIRLRLQKACET
jgi:uncharacterized protein